jgi:nitrite reductase (cytochrome c-552)
VSYTAKYVEITEETNDPEHWAKNFPRQYASFMKTKETGTIKTPFGGNAREDKLKKYPDYVRIWGGKMPFAVDYASARGHHYAMIDQVETKRVISRRSSSRVRAPTATRVTGTSWLPKWGSIT